MLTKNLLKNQLFPNPFNAIVFRWIRRNSIYFEKGNSHCWAILKAHFIIIILQINFIRKEVQFKIKLLQKQIVSFIVILSRMVRYLMTFLTIV